MDSFRNLALVLVAALVLPWVFLIATPSCQMRNLAPVALGDDNLGVSADYYPSHQTFAAGAKIYQQEGCMLCHSQMLRDPRAGDDIFRLGWGREQGLDTDEPENSPIARPSLREDYMGEKYAPLGLERVGPDLSNVGHRRPDRNWHLLHLYQPRAVTHWSTMPPMKHLFDVRKIAGQPSKAALRLPDGYGPKDGYEVVPTEEAEILVQYLLSLKRDSQAPDALLPTNFIKVRDGIVDEVVEPEPAEPAPDAEGADDVKAPDADADQPKAGEPSAE